MIEHVINVIPFKMKTLLKPILPPEGIQVVDPNKAFQIVWMLKGVTKRGQQNHCETLNMKLLEKLVLQMIIWMHGF